MSLPTEADFALIKIGDGEVTEAFTIACGIQDASINTVANTSDRYARDCATPGATPVRKVKVSGKQLDITGSGLIDKANIAIFQSALGVSGNYKIELYQDDGTSTGDLMGTIAGAFVMTSHNMNIPIEGQASAEISLANNGAWTWTAEA